MLSSGDLSECRRSEPFILGGSLWYPAPKGDGGALATPAKDTGFKGNRAPVSMAAWREVGAMAAKLHLGIGTLNLIVPINKTKKRER